MVWPVKSGGQLGFLDIISVSLVDDDAVGHFHNAALDALQFVTRTCKLDQQEEIDHGMYGRFTLSHTDCFNKDLVETGCFTQDDGLTGLRATPPNDPAEGLGRINDFG